MSKARDWLISTLVLLVGRRRAQPQSDALRLVPKRAPHPSAETAALTLLGLSSACAVGFVVVYAVESIPRQTQFLGLSLGLALLFLAAALIVAGKWLVTEEELLEPYPPHEHPHEQELVEQLFTEAGDGLTRRRLLRLGLLGAFGTLGFAALVPALSFGPLLRVKEFFGTPWRRGTRLVDEAGRPYKASDIEEKNFYTAFAEGAGKEELGASLIVIRLPVHELRLPARLAGYDANGIVAFSKICTHAGCAVSLYRVPTFAPVEPKPALVCPCHYSTFDPATGGTVLFGPAGRPLPMLPLEIDARGYLRAKGNFDGAIGPAWWGVRNRKPSP